jgi:hypothetical protein
MRNITTTEWTALALTAAMTLAPLVPYALS